jgi:hypothetical protein
MSWSVSCQGTKAGVLVEAAVQFEAAAKTYETLPEGVDIEMVKARVLDAVASSTPNGKQGISVAASGNRSSGYLSLTVTVQTVTLVLDPPAAPPAHASPKA